MKPKNNKTYIYALLLISAVGAILAGCASGERQSGANPSETRTVPQASSPAAVQTATSPALSAARTENEDEKAITVYKSPTCGCCTMWEEHLTKAGFKVTSNKTDKLAEIRKQYGVPEKAQSCHTAIVGGYVIEGHVPASDVEKLLKTRPADIVGLAAPGMPPKSPGMQSEGEKPSGYDVVSFDKNGQTKVFTSYLP
jgi:hypothetical protein